MQGYDVDHDDDGPGHDPRGPHARNGAPDDEGSRVRSDAAHQGANLEDADADHVDPLRVVEFVYSAHDEHQGSHGQEVGRRVPAHIAEGVEVVGDDGYCCCDDGAIL